MRTCDNMQCLLWTNIVSFTLNILLFIHCVSDRGYLNDRQDILQAEYKNNNINKDTVLNTNNTKLTEKAILKLGRLQKAYRSQLYHVRQLRIVLRKRSKRVKTNVLRIRNFKKSALKRLRLLEKVVKHSNIRASNMKIIQKDSSIYEKKAYKLYIKASNSAKTVKTISKKFSRNPFNSRLSIEKIRLKLLFMKVNLNIIQRNYKKFRAILKNKFGRFKKMFQQTRHFKKNLNKRMRKVESVVRKMNKKCKNTIQTKSYKRNEIM